MNGLIIVLRLIHIGMGAVWVGAATFTAFFLAPAIQDVGPDGGKIMAALQRRGLMTFMPLLGLGTILSGIWLYWRDSAGFQPGFSQSPIGMAYGLGGVLAVIVLILGLFVMRPAMIQAGALAQSLGTATPAEREQRLPEIQRLRDRGAMINKLVAVLLLLAVSAMAVARYL